MLIKVGNNEVKIPNRALFVGALVADNMYANHCKKKACENFAKAAKDIEPKKEKVEMTSKGSLVTAEQIL